MERIVEAYLQLRERVDEHAARVSAAHGEQLACASGCSGCCHRQLSVFPVEAWLLAREELSPAGRPPDPPHLDVLGPVDEPCALLDDEGRCRAYEARPLICRTHGLPVAVPDGDGLRGDVCPVNFRDGLGHVPSADFLNLATLNATLAAIHAAWCQATGDDPERRVPLSELV